MKRSFIGAVVVGVAVFSLEPVRADAQMASYLNRCATGGLGACFSVTVNTTVTGPNTQVVIRVTNLEGAAGFSVAGAVALSQVTLWGTPSIPSGNGYPTQPTSATGSNASANGNATPWFWSTPFFGGEIRVSPQGGAPLVGCTVPAGMSDYWQTCGTSQAFVMDFDIPWAWSVPQDVGITMSYTGTPQDNGRCSMGTGAATGRGIYDCVEVTPDLPPPMTIPEPTTIFTLASGLLVLFGAGARRERASKG